MAKILQRLVSIFALLFCSDGYSDELPSAKLGAILPLTGEMSFAGEDVRNGLILAREELRNTRYDYQLVFEDNRLEAGRSVAAAKKLIEVDKVDALITLWPPTAHVVAPIAERAGVLHYTIAWDPSIARSNKYALSHQSMVGEFVDATLSLLKEQRVTKLSFFHLNESGFNLGADAVRQRAPGYGITLVQVSAFDAGQRDFRTQLAKAKQSGADGVLLWAVLPELDILLKQYKEMGLEGAMTGFFDVVTDLASIEGLSFVSEVHSTSDFAEKYRSRFKRDFSLKAPNAFDILNLFVGAYERFPNRKPSAAELKDQLIRTKKYHGAVGIVDIDAFGNSSYPPAIKKIVRGRTVEVRDAVNRFTS